MSAITEFSTAPGLGVDALEHQVQVRVLRVPMPDLQRLVPIQSELPQHALGDRDDLRAIHPFAWTYARER